METVTEAVVSEGQARKRRGGRPPGRLYNEWLHVRVSPKDRAALKRIMAREGLADEAKAVRLALELAAGDGEGSVHEEFTE